MKKNLLTAIIFSCMLTFPLSAHSQETILSGTSQTTSDVDLFADDWAEQKSTPTIKDPYESFNRFMFGFNSHLKKFVMDPLSVGYNFVIPKKAQSCLHNAFSNARAPGRFFNSLFQKKYKGAGHELGRFLVNSTIGIGGLFDPAYAALNWEPSEEDFGQTLGYHNIGEGVYFVWPIFGPATTRDTAGFAGDMLFDPVTWFGILNTFEEDEILRIISGVKRVNNYSFHVKERYETMMHGAIDPYVAVRHAYVEYRRKKLQE